VRLARWPCLPKKWTHKSNKTVRRMPCQEIPMLHRWREQQVSSTTTQRLRREAMDLPATAAPSFIPQRTVRRRTPASSWMESPVEIHVHHSHSLACTSTSHVRRHSSVRQGARCDLRRQHSFRRTRRPSSTWFRSNVVARTCITPSSQPRMTCPTPMRKRNFSPRSREESNFCPFASVPV